MQKYLLAAFACLATLTSCAPTLRTEADMGPLSTHGMVRQQFQGHSYIVTKGPVSPVHTMHDPDCGCDKATVTGPTAPKDAYPSDAPVAPYVPMQPLRLFTKPVVALAVPVLPGSVDKTNPLVPVIKNSYQSMKKDTYLRSLAAKAELLLLQDSPGHEVLDFLETEIAKLGSHGLTDLQSFLRAELDKVASSQSIKEIIQKLIEKLKSYEA